MDLPQNQLQGKPFSEIYLDCVQQFCNRHDETGCVQPGINGPHNEAETPLRNICHWIIALAGAYRLTNCSRYYAKAEELVARLCSSELRPHGASYLARVSKGVDRCNGLIGQAWVLEALGEMSTLTGSTKFREIGIELVLRHKFAWKWSLWHSLDIDGRNLNIDNVFNHQLWFAATASMVNKGDSGEINAMIASFMNALDRNLTLDGHGYVAHHIDRIRSAPSVRLSGLMKHMRQGTVLQRLHRPKGTTNGIKDPALFKVGYQSFNAYGFALLKRETRGHPFWGTNEVEKLTRILWSAEYLRSLRGNPFAFGYNPPGFEVPFALQELAVIPREKLALSITQWISRQVHYSYDPYVKSMSRNAPDPATQAARLYEISRIAPEHLKETRIVVPDDAETLSRIPDMIN